MQQAPIEIWAYPADDIGDDGASIVGYESAQPHSQKYIRIDFATSQRVRHYLEKMDDELLAREGSAELSHEEAKQALRDVYLITCGELPEFHPHRFLQR